MDSFRALSSGLLGAVTLTILHETTRKLLPDAPRMDLLGEEALTKVFNRLGTKKPATEDSLHNITLIGDIFSNALFYSLTGLGKKKHSFVLGSLLGLGAGIAAILLPERLGLSKNASKKNSRTMALTMALYLAGGLASAAARNFWPGTETAINGND